jgi:hypothetical protein
MSERYYPREVRNEEGAIWEVDESPDACECPAIWGKGGRVPNVSSTRLEQSNV